MTAAFHVLVLEPRALAGGLCLERIFVRWPPGIGQALDTAALCTTEPAQAPLCLKSGVADCTLHC